MILHQVTEANYSYTSWNNLCPNIFRMNADSANLPYKKPVLLELVDLALQEAWPRADAVY